MKTINRKVEMPVMQTRASVVPASFNEKERTVQVVWSVGSRVKRYAWDIGVYYEELSMDPAHIRLDRMVGGSCNVLDNHDQYTGMRAVVGKVRDAEIKDGQGICTVKFSRKQLAAEIMADVQDGIGDTISVGYLPHAMEKVSETEGVPVYRVIDWEPMEISFVPVPADPEAKARSIRSDDLKSDCLVSENINEQKENTMTDAEKKALEEKRALEIKEAQEKAAKEAVEMEQKRCLHIQTVATRAQLSQEFVTRMIAEKKTIDQVNAEVTEELVRKQETVKNQTPVVEVGANRAHEAAVKGVENALLVRTKVESKISDEGRDFMGDGLLRMFEELEAAKGRKVRGLSRMQLAGRALHSDSDLPGILSAVANKHMMKGYGQLPQDWRPMVSEYSALDFKLINGYNLDLAGTLDEKAPGAEYTHTTLEETGESYKVKTYGKAIGFTREMLINDDLRALTEVPLKFGQAGAKKENALFFEIFSSNPTMGEDDVVLFHNSHRNLGTNAGVTNDAINALMKLIEKQKDADDQYIQALGGFIVAASDYKYTLQALLAPVAAVKATEVNVFAGKYQLITSPLLATGYIYGAASKDSMDLIEVAYLDGQKGVYIEEKVDFNTDGVILKARLDVGMKAMNFRGFSRCTIT
jgi:hypothetical protein